MLYPKPLLWNIIIIFYNLKLFKELIFFYPLLFKLFYDNFTNSINNNNFLFKNIEFYIRYVF